MTTAVARRAGSGPRVTNPVTSSPAQPWPTSPRPRVLNLPRQRDQKGSTVTNRPFIRQRVDDALNEIIAGRESALRALTGRDKLARVADLLAWEAELWGELHEVTTSITQARAAIRARQHAQSEAARLRSRAAASPAMAA